MLTGYYITKLKIQPNTVTLYRKWEGERTNKMKDCDLVANFDGKKEPGTLPNRQVRRAYCGQMTKGSRKRMVDAINLFSQCCRVRWVTSYSVRQKKMKRFKHKFAFVTLTIPINDYRVKGSEGYKNMLAPFIDWLTKTMGVNTYIWKAELQSPLYFQSKKKKLSKGQLHYHMVIPNFIKHELIRDKWNTLLRKNNYTTIQNPPSTSIEKPYKGKNTCDYIIKEITKNCVSDRRIMELEAKIKKAIETNNQIEIIDCQQEMDDLNYLIECSNTDLQGKVWGCSNNLKPKSILPEHLQYDKEKLTESIDYYIKKIDGNKLNPYYKGGGFFVRKPLPLHPSNLSIGKIHKIVDSINRIYSDYEGYLILMSDKSQLQWLRKKRMKLYVKQPRCFEIEYSREVHQMLVNIVAGYRFPIEGSKDWVITNYKNDYVEKWTMPNDYHVKLLEARKIVYAGADGIATAPLIYEYEQFLVDRVGEVNMKDFVKKTYI